MARHLVPVKLPGTKGFLYPLCPNIAFLFPPLFLVLFSFFSLSHTVPPVVTFKKSHHNHQYYNHSFLIFLLFPFPQHRSSQSKNHITITNITITNFRIISHNHKFFKKKIRKKITEQLSAARRREGRPSPRAEHGGRLAPY